MKLLLDTHTFMWWDSSPAKISEKVLTLLRNPDSQVLLSLASLWEIQIKSQLGKLTLRDNLADIVLQQQNENGIILLPIEFSHILALEQLPLHHRDPFDRLLIAQSRIEAAAIATRDELFQRYPRQTTW
ncbi:type II toxin-antitoxin system VapC family toxin [Nodosilinea nodulosa]|uniref:type II toxin-antitoxin system VapC family toxin n=1 Tax=Nodosilinea nodulosa TaxID=416001 RepID=UPI00036A33E0|nr:type II toxin-antitoxin system VapC family toxin [Nodosilinea nodulosa]